MDDATTSTSARLESLERGGFGNSTASAGEHSAGLEGFEIPEHELLLRIGAGSYGEVWLARNRTGAFRAVKAVYRKSFERERPYEREFAGLQKFEPISRSHEGLVDVLQIGRNDLAGHFYYVMELADSAKNAPSIRGGQEYESRTLKRELKDRGRLPLEECVQIGLTMASALAHLHRNGLVHRDIKPSNIIFVNGAAKLADIGLVAEISEARSFVGTEGFIAPEGPGTPRADLYSLGKVLYEISTGLDRQEFPALPPDLKERSDRTGLSELNEIIVKACAPNPGERYTNAEAMGSELALLQAGQSVKRKRSRQQWLGRCGVALLITILVLATVSAVRLLQHSYLRTEHSPKFSSKDDATQCYKLGMNFYERNTGVDMREAVRLFEKAVEIDPDFALAHAALAKSCCWGLQDFKPNFPKARQHALRALKLDPTLAWPHTVLGMIKHHVDWDWTGSERELRTAIQLAPNDSSSHEWYGVYLCWMGRYHAAIRELQKADKLSTHSPQLSLSIRMLLAGAYQGSRQDDLAFREYQRVIAVETNRPTYAYLGLANLYELRGEFPKAIKLRETWTRLTKYEDPATASRRYSELREAFAQKQAGGYWQKRIEWAQRDGEDCVVAEAYALLGKPDDAFKALWLEFKSDPAKLACDILSDPALSCLRSDSRYAELLRAMKLK